MADLMSLLMQAVGGENDYLAKDPWYTTGAGLAKAQLPAPQDNAQAFLMPILQGLVSGGMAGYGKKNALEAQFDAYKKSPLMGALTDNMGPVASGDVYGKMMTYGQEDAPKGWTPTVGLQDILLGASGIQAQQEAKAKIQELKDEVQFKSTPEYLQQVTAEKEAAAKGTAAGEGSKDLKPILLKETAIKAQEKQMEEFAHQEFERAKELTGTMAGIGANTGIPTKKGEALEALRQGLVSQLDRAVGREHNDKIKAQLLSFTPHWSDSAATIKEKEKNFINFAKSLFDATPVTDALGVTSETSTPSAPEKVVNGVTYVKVPGGWQSK